MGQAASDIDKGILGYSRKPLENKERHDGCVCEGDSRRVSGGTPEARERTQHVASTRYDRKHG